MAIQKNQEEGKISEIEKAVQLSERIMRVLILSTEGRGGEDIEKGPPAMRAKRYGRKAAQSEELEQSAEPVVLEAVQPEQSDGAGSNSEQVNEQDESRPSEGRDEKESEEN